MTIQTKLWLTICAIILYSSAIWYHGYHPLNHPDGPDHESWLAWEQSNYYREVIHDVQAVYLPRTDKTRRSSRDSSK